MSSATPCWHCQWKTQVLQGTGTQRLKGEVQRCTGRLFLSLLSTGEQTALHSKTRPRSQCLTSNCGTRRALLKRATLCRCSPMLSVRLKIPGLRMVTLGKPLQELVKRVSHKAETGEAPGKQCPRSSLTKARLSPLAGLTPDPQRRLQVAPTANPSATGLWLDRWCRP